MAWICQYESILCVGWGWGINGKYDTFSFADGHRQGVVVVGTVLGLPIKHSLGLGGDVSHTTGVLL